MILQMIKNNDASDSVHSDVIRSTGRHISTVWKGSLRVSFEKLINRIFPSKLLPRASFFCFCFCLMSFSFVGLKQNHKAWLEGFIVLFLVYLNTTFVTAYSFVLVFKLVCACVLLIYMFIYMFMYVSVHVLLQMYWIQDL